MIGRDEYHRIILRQSFDADDLMDANKRAKKKMPSRGEYVITQVGGNNNEN